MGTHSLANNEPVTQQVEIDALLAVDGDGSETTSFVFPSLVSYFAPRSRKTERSVSVVRANIKKAE